MQLLLGILPIAVLLFTNKKFDLSFRLFLYSSILSTFVIIITTHFGINNHIVALIYIIISYSFIYNFFRKYFSIEIIRYLNLLVLIFYIIAIVEYFLNNRLNYTIPIYYLNILIWAVIYFYSQLISNDDNNNDKIRNIIVFSLLFYSSFSFLISIIIHKLIYNHLWYIHNFIEGSSKLLIAYAFWKLPKTSHY